MEPLVVALRILGGEIVVAAQIIMDVAQDVIKRIAEDTERDTP